MKRHKEKAVNTKKVIVIGRDRVALLSRHRAFVERLRALAAEIQAAPFASRHVV